MTEVQFAPSSLPVVLAFLTQTPGETKTEQEEWSICQVLLGTKLRCGLPT